MTFGATTDSATRRAVQPARRNPLANTGSARKMLVIAVIVLAAIAVRLVFFKYQSGDYTAYFSRWYSYIKDNGGFSALKNNFANYNEPYLYLLAGLTYTPIPELAGIKLMSVVFDFLLGFFAYRIVNLRYPNRWWPILAGALVLFLPTVVLNSSMWGQADSMYSAFGVGAVYFLLRRRPWLACLFFGLAFSFKLQIIFLFPLLLLLVLRKYVPWRALLLIPGVYLVLEIPALLVGASPSTLLSVYLTQTNTYDQLTLNAPNIYQYFSTTTSTVLRYGGIGLTGVLLLALIIPAVVRRVELTPTRILLAGTVSVLLVPYFLPAMHERYFYLADTLTVLSAFYLPRKLWALPILEQFASLFSYLPFLLMTAGVRGSGARGAFPGGTGRFPAGGFPGGNSGGGYGGGGFPGGGNPGQAPTLPTPGTGSLPATGGSGGFGGGGAAGAAGRGGFGTSTNTVVSFTILSTVMLAALLLAVWVAVREFRRTNPVEPLDGTNPPPLAGDEAESTVGITSESAKKPRDGADQVAESTGQPVEKDSHVWGS
ncbi:MAG TPA: hypothetical protein VHX38_37745 [Pseudonocardiaceae bacterium]|nr:hypothetical protein [Pseudonocardiaceae bacterium]